MPWSINAGELDRVRSFDPAISQVRELRPPRGRGLYHGAITPVLGRLPAARNIRPTMTAVARFAPTDQAVSPGSPD